MNRRHHLPDALALAVLLTGALVAAPAAVRESAEASRGASRALETTAGLRLASAGTGVTGTGVASARDILSAPGRAVADRPPGALCLAAALLAPSAPLAPACAPATTVADWLPYAPADDPTLTAAPTRWTLPIVVTGTALALTERAAFYGTYAAWWTQTPSAPWPFGQATITATATVTFTPGVTTTATATPLPLDEPTPTAVVTATATLTATVTTTPTVFFTVTPTPSSTPTTTRVPATITPTRTDASTDAPPAAKTATSRPTATATPVLFPCRFTPTRCGTRLFVPFNGKGRRR